MQTCLYLYHTWGCNYSPILLLLVFKDIQIQHRCINHLDAYSSFISFQPAFLNTHCIK